MMISENTNIVISLWTIGGLIISIIVFTVKITSMKNKIDNDINTLKEKALVEEKERVILIAKTNSYDITLAKLQITMENMEKILVKISSKLDI